MLKTIYKALEKPNLSKYGLLIQKVIALNIIINIVVVFIREIITLNNEVLAILNIINTITITIFIVELLLRYISIGQDTQYSGIKGRI